MSCALASLGRADEFIRPQSFHELDSRTTVEDAVRVNGAEVAWADYGALRRDFPAIRSLSDEQIKGWLLQNFAYVGSEQPRLAGVRNSAMNLDPHATKPAFRPPGWNRSAVLEAFDPNGLPIGLVDVKGFGHGVLTAAEVSRQVTAYGDAQGRQGRIDALRITDHSDGLMALGEGIAECSRQIAAQRLFEMSGLSLETVESYAIIRLPFNLLKKGGVEIPAALYLRQAHGGRFTGVPVPEAIYIDPRGEGQMTERGTAVDMGGVIIRDPRLKNNFGMLDDGTNTQRSKPWKYGHETADAFAFRDDRRAVRRHLQEMLSPLDADYQASPERQAYEQFATSRAEFLSAQRARGLPPAEIAQIYAQWARTQPYEQRRFERALRHSDRVIREGAAATLRGRTDGASLPLIEIALQDADDAVRRCAAQALRGRADGASLVLIEKALRDSDRYVRGLAAEALRGRNESAALVLIELALHDSIAFVVGEHAVEALQGRSDGASLALIEKMLRNPGGVFTTRSIRGYAAQALGGRMDSASLALIEEALGDSDSFVRVHAARALQGRNESAALTLIEKALGDPEGLVRAGAAAALQGRDDGASLALIEKAMQDLAVGVRESAVQALQGRTDSASLALIEKALQDFHPFLRGRAAQALQGRNDGASMILIEKAFQDSNIAVRGYAIQALRGRTDSASLVLLERALRDVEAVSLHAVQALLGRSDSASLALIETAMRSSFPSVRAAAIEFLLVRTDVEAQAVGRRLLATPGLDSNLRFKLMKMVPPQTCFMRVLEQLSGAH